jgi:hypothetical protein
MGTALLTGTWIDCRAQCLVLVRRVLVLVLVLVLLDDA